LLVVENKLAKFVQRYLTVTTGILAILIKSP
jgi:hypothetical protein